MSTIIDGETIVHVVLVLSMVKQSTGSFVVVREAVERVKAVACSVDTAHGSRSRLVVLVCLLDTRDGVVGNCFAKSPGISFLRLFFCELY